MGLFNNVVRAARRLVVGTPLRLAVVFIIFTSTIRYLQINAGTSVSSSRSRPSTIQQIQRRSQNRILSKQKLDAPKLFNFTIADFVYDDVAPRKSLVKLSPVTRQFSNVRILTWTKKCGSCSGPWFREGKWKLSNCELPEGATCEYYHNRTLYNISDVIIFSGIFLNADDMPDFRSTNQTWGFINRESPISTDRRLSLAPFANLFNYTETYARDADLATPYGACVPKERPSNEQIQDYAASKTELVVWFASNCKTPTRREHYVAELQKYIPVHIFGRCGNLTCGNKTCEEEILRQKYKFYLAFENSLCNDYATEKFWKCFQFDIVPVVYGAAAYEELAPRNSFIDIRQFSSPKHLAEYLISLGKNDTKYNEFFSWKKTHSCRLRDKSLYTCQLCRFLHERKLGPRASTVTAPHVARMWSSKTQCQDVSAFRKSCNCWPESE